MLIKQDSTKAKKSIKDEESIKNNNKSLENKIQSGDIVNASQNVSIKEFKLGFDSEEESEDSE